MLGQNKKIGKWGEQLAKDFLIKAGYQVIADNWTRKIGEIDLVAIKDNAIVFVEVKTRSTPFCGWGEEAVNHAKKKKISLLIDRYLLEEKKYQDFFPRFDIIIVELISLTPKFIHYENVLLT